MRDSNFVHDEEPQTQIRAAGRLIQVSRQLLEGANAGQRVKVVLEP